MQDQPVEVVGCCGATRDVSPADPAPQPSIGNDQFGGAIQSGVGRCDIRFQRSEPAGDIGDRCIGITILIEKLIVGIDFKSEVVDPIQHSIDKIEPAKFFIGPIILYVVKASGDTILIIPMEDLKGALAGSITAQPGIQTSDVIGIQHHIIEAVDLPEPGDDQLVEAIGGLKASRDRGGLRSPSQAWIPSDPTHGLIQPGARTTDRLPPVGGVGAKGGGHGGFGGNGLVLCFVQILIF